ncbi:hypothetical protein [Niallia circulans]|uniref:Uncharacterized protein n=1 Tax=Niallia circulans TaxID=1397 RepID=A0A941GH33_NIACI|nr:hypothetical protein [Niallia circulans]MCB5238644.1 hypothetical protein [Niallia circulans]
MAAKKNAQAWAEAKKRCRLNNVEIQMAKELGMTPKVLLKNIPASSQQWKAPVKEWIRNLYEEKFDKDLTGKHDLIEKSPRKVKKQPNLIVSDSWIDKEDLPF